MSGTRATRDRFPSTYENYRYTIKLLKEGFGELKLVNIKPIHVENYLKRMAKEGRSQSSLSKLRGMMFQIMKKAAANDLIRKNPVEFADHMRNVKPQENTKDSFTAEEIERLMVLLPDNRIGHSIRLMIGTGMRTQELLGLEPRHIAPDGSNIKIEQAVTMVKGTPQLGPPKTQSSYREIPVPEKYRPSALFSGTRNRSSCGTAKSGTGSATPAPFASNTGQPWKSWAV